MVSNRSNKQGFTIIEVVLVLAIAGLIFAAVFIGLPTLQRNQRDLQRKQTVDFVFAAAQSYYAKNHKMPYTTSQSGQGKYVVKVELDINFVNRYIDSQCIPGRQFSKTYLNFKECGTDFTSPSGKPYLLTVHDTEMGSINHSTYAYSSYRGDHVITMLPYSDCGKGHGERKYQYNKNDFSVEITLESGARYCVDNSSTGSKGNSN